MKPVIIISLILALFSCRKEIKFNIPNEDQILVVNSNLCADSFISFNLSYTQSITDNSFRTEDSATIEIFNIDTTISFGVINPSPNGYYQSTIKAKASDVYLVKISVGKQKYWTSDSVPQVVEGQISDIDSAIFQGRANFYRLTYELSDKQAYTNYYGIRVKHYFATPVGLTDTIIEEEWVDIETIDPVLSEAGNNKFSKKHLLFTDQRFNNTTISFTFGTSAISNTGTRKSKKLVVFVEQYSFRAYQYYASLNEHIFYQNDPFSQPTEVKGNISHAFGSFTGRNMRADSITFKY